jgi:threonylcarbamoyladenosine tRNA methylthiotransferase MtaB
LKVYVETIGCKLNRFESEALSQNFRASYIDIADRIEEADYIVVNTCSVTGRADIKSIQAMKRAKKLGKKVVATGCYTTTDYDKIKETGIADIIVKNRDKYSIPEIIREKEHMPESYKENTEISEFPIVRHFERTRAFIKIQDGCDKVCTYCKIPAARGRSRSIPAKVAINYAEDLIQRGYREIVFTGVNISEYLSGDVTLYDLVRSIISLKGDFRLRLSSLQPDEFDTRLIGLLDTGKLAAHFHLSLQSGSAGVLERMGRSYSPEFYLCLVEKIRSKDESCGITTDIIAGFPGETEKEFEETLTLVGKAGFTRAHIFPFSPRPRTRAYFMKNLPDKIKRERVSRLEEKVYEEAARFAGRTLLGRPCRALLEKIEDGKWTGYTSNYIRIRTEGAGRPNTMAYLVPSKIIRNGQHLELCDG